MTRWLRVAMVFVAALTLGCAGAAKQSHESGTGNTLTAEQLARANSDNLFDAINKLRPTWLTSRGPTSVTNSTPTAVSVFMGGTYLGKADYLQQMRVADVIQVKYWDAATASARFGMGHPRGVIELTRK